MSVNIISPKKEETGSARQATGNGQRAGAVRKHREVRESAAHKRREVCESAAHKRREAKSTPHHIAPAKIKQGANNMISLPKIEQLGAKVSEFEACIFDFDGTLARSMWVWEHIDYYFCREHGLELPDGYDTSVIGLGFEGTAAYFREKMGLDMSVQECCDEFNRLAYDKYANEVELVPGAAEYLEFLAELHAPIALASSLNEKLLRACFENHGITKYFDAICLCDDYKTHKNEPLIYKVSAEKLGANPARCIVFEDIAPGIKSAASLDMTCVGVLDEENVAQDTEELKALADVTIRDFYELLP